jgi:phosphomannomutase
MKNIECFKAYDIRGKVPGELNTGLAYKIGLTYGKFIDAKKVVIGHDIRKS